MATAIRPEIMARESFETFAIGTDGRAHPLDDHDDLQDAIGRATLRTPHKGTFEVRHTNHRTGVVLRRFYRVRLKAPVRRLHEHVSRMVADPFAEHLFDLAGDVL